MQSTTAPKVSNLDTAEASKATRLPVLSSISISPDSGVSQIQVSVPTNDGNYHRVSRGIGDYFARLSYGLV